MMVGSIITTAEEGERVRRGQEFGYFAFGALLFSFPLSIVLNILNEISIGGSTIVLLFEKGAVHWDEDLLINSRASLETLVRVGMHIGKARCLKSTTDPQS